MLLLYFNIVFGISVLDIVNMVTNFLVSRIDDCFHKLYMTILHCRIIVVMLLLQL